MCDFSYQITENLCVCVCVFCHGTLMQSNVLLLEKLWYSLLPSPTPAAPPPPPQVHQMMIVLQRIMKIFADLFIRLFFLQQSTKSKINKFFILCCLCDVHNTNELNLIYWYNTVEQNINKKKYWIQYQRKKNLKLKILKKVYIYLELK